FLITVFALVFSISGPVLLFLTRAIAPKTVILVAFVVFAVGDLLTIFGHSYGVLVLSRILLAASGALLTVLSLALASRICTPEQRGRAIGLVVMGISASLVWGLRIGVSLGHLWGWRCPFLLNLSLVAILFGVVLVFLGQISIERRPTPLPKVWNSLKERPVTLAHFTTFFVLAGHFRLYGSLTPFVASQLG